MKAANSLVKPKAATRPSKNSLIARGLVRDANNRIQCGSKPVPTKMGRKAKYTLYSSESDTEPVKRINSGLDRCASLLANILESDEKEINSPFVRKKKTIKSKTKPRIQRKVKSSQEKRKQDKSSSVATAGMSDPAHAKNTNDIENTEVIAKTQRRAHNTPPACHGDILGRDVETLVQTVRFADDMSFPAVISNTAANPNQFSTEIPKDADLNPVLQTKKPVSGKEVGCIHPESVLPLRPFEETTELSPRYKELEDALLRISSKLNAPLKCKPPAPNESSHDESLTSVASPPQKMPTNEKAKFGDTNQLPRFSTPTTDQNSEDNVTPKRCPGIRRKIRKVPRVTADPDSGLSSSEISFKDERGSNHGYKLSNHETNANVCSPLDNQRLIVGKDFSPVTNRVTPSLVNEGTIKLSIKSVSSERGKESKKTQTPPVRDCESTVTTSSPVTVSVQTGGHPESSPYTRGRSPTNPDHKLTYLLFHLFKYASRTGWSDLMDLAENIESCAHQVSSNHQREIDHKNQTALSNLQSDKEHLLEKLKAANEKCMEYEKAVVNYKQLLTTALEEKREHILKRQEQLILEKRIHDLLKGSSALEEENKSLAKEIYVKEEKIRHMQSKHENEERRLTHHVHDLEKTIRQNEFSVQLLKKENGILTVTLQQSQTESERLRELNSGLKQTLANLMNDLESQEQPRYSADIFESNRREGGMDSSITLRSLPQDITANHKDIDHGDQVSIINENASSTIDEVEFNERLQLLDAAIMQFQNSLRSKRL